MTNSERIENLLSRAAASTMESIDIPLADHVAIARRAERSNLRRPAGVKWLAIGAAAAALIALLFLPPVKNALARAAHTFLTMTYFPSSHKNQAPVPGQTATIEQARAITAFHFVEPRGLPAGYQLIAVVKAPVGALRQGVTLRYVSSANPIGLAMFESAGTPSRKVAFCWVLRSVRARAGLLNHPERYRGGPLPPGMKSIPCNAWNVGGTRIQLVDMTGALTPAEIRHVIEATR